MSVNKSCQSVETSAKWGLMEVEAYVKEKIREEPAKSCLEKLQIHSKNGNSKNSKYGL